ncbi:MAG: hypothetical protein RL716_215 [Actinomycetota bacterium]|jgi:hypothetical protein
MKNLIMSFAFYISASLVTLSFFGLGVPTHERLFTNTFMLGIFFIPLLTYMAIAVVVIGEKISRVPENRKISRARRVIYFFWLCLPGIITMSMSFLEWLQDFPHSRFSVLDFSLMSLFPASLALITHSFIKNLTA